MTNNQVQQIIERLEALGISDVHRATCRLPLYKEAEELVAAGVDMFDRPVQMTKTAYDAWLAMHNSAAEDNIELMIVSAFRSITYQCDLIQRKIDQGWEIDNILKINAIPGHSEHHTGRALDLHSGGDEPLTEAFDKTEAFRWLCDHAEEFGYRLSYPRDNTQGIDYEPWHWCYRD